MSDMDFVETSCLHLFESWLNGYCCMDSIIGIFGPDPDTSDWGKLLDPIEPFGTWAIQERPQP